MNDAKDVLGSKKKDADIDLATSLARVQRQFGKSPVTQSMEVAKLAFGKQRITAQEYFYYRLFDDERYSAEATAEFLGKRVQPKYIRRCNQLEWWGIAHDKLAFSAMLGGLGLTTPKILAVAHPFRVHGDIPVLQTAEALAAFLREGMSYPFFCKPVMGIFSQGVAAVSAHDPTEDRLILAGDRVVKVRDFCEEVFSQEDGYLFQEQLSPHPALRKMSGDGLSTIRMVVFLIDEGPELWRALWKVIGAANVADNFWREGNMLAAVDEETGEVTRVIRGLGLDQEEIESHPDTGQALLHAALPDWVQARKLCLTAAASFPNLRLQAWDVALTDTGPTLIELNIGGDFNLPQLAHGRGMMDERFKDLLDSVSRKARAKKR
ncbi:MAG: sugar-transfer associated ATP-grasp domain-containing protein [Pseudomonadota bacterium]|nr:sugar-transfer associated ATP-grasp domain-containing protein [Pseudomonadota bacterium]